MCDRPWETMTDADFEAMLARSVPDVPPEEIVAEVTPWRRAMNRILFGMALCAITLNFLCLNYILPAIGTVLLLLGFRTLRQENRWLGGCFAITVVRAAYFFMTLILNTTILQSAVFTPPSRPRSQPGTRCCSSPCTSASGGDCWQCRKKRACQRGPAARSR